MNHESLDDQAAAGKDQEPIAWFFENCHNLPDATYKNDLAHLWLFFRVFVDLRGGFKRESEMGVNFFSPDNDLINQALSYGLAHFKRESFEIISQQPGKGLGVVNDLLPADSYEASTICESSTEAMWSVRIRQGYRKCFGPISEVYVCLF